jgi:hypothetical protein
MLARLSRLMGENKWGKLFILYILHIYILGEIAGEELTFLIYCGAARYSKLSREPICETTKKNKQYTTNFAPNFTKEYNNKNSRTFKGQGHEFGI